MKPILAILVEDASGIALETTEIEDNKPTLETATVDQIVPIAATQSILENKGSLENPLATKSESSSEDTSRFRNH